MQVQRFMDLELIWYIMKLIKYLEDFIDKKIKIKQKKKHRRLLLKQKAQVKALQEVNKIFCKWSLILGVRKKLIRINQFRASQWQEKRKMVYLYKILDTTSYLMAVKERLKRIAEALTLTNMKWQMKLTHYFKVIEKDLMKLELKIFSLTFWK